MIDADQHGLFGGAPDGVGERPQSGEIVVISRIDGHAGQAGCEQGGHFVRQLCSFEAEEQSFEHFRLSASEGVETQNAIVCSSGISQGAIMRDPSYRYRASGRGVKLRIEARAPTRIDLAGGTLDIWPLYLFHPGALTVNCAITRYASCAVETAPRGSRRITLISLDTRRRESFASLAALSTLDALPVAAAGPPRASFPAAQQDLCCAPIRKRPPARGFAALSAMAVAISAALDRLTRAGFSISRSRLSWAATSKRRVIAVPTGTQDRYPPALSGHSVIHLDKGRPAKAQSHSAVNLKGIRAAALMLCYTGKPRQSGDQ